MLEDSIATLPVLYEHYDNYSVCLAGEKLPTNQQYKISNIIGSGYSTVELRGGSNKYTLLMQIHKIVFKNGLMYYERIFSDSVGIGGFSNLGFTMSNNDIYQISFNFDYVGNKIWFS